MRFIRLALVIAAGATVTACGGTGSDGTAPLASTPPPIVTPASAPAPSGPVALTSTTIVSRTALGPNAATEAGAHGTLAWLSDQAFDHGHPGARTDGYAGSSAVDLSYDPASPAFTIRARFADGAVERTYVAPRTTGVTGGIVPDFYDNFGYDLMLRLGFSDGTSSTQEREITQFLASYSVGVDPQSRRLSTSLTTHETSSFGTEIGQRYVAYGAWALSDFNDTATSTVQTRERSAQFLHGDRTSASDLPLNGKASYADRMGYLNLNADFGARSVSADLNYPAQVYQVSDDSGYYHPVVQMGVKASGASFISPAGDFAIPLSGTSITPDIKASLPDVAAPVTGTFYGAFFGPRAAEAAGFAEILKATGERLWDGQPFLLQQH